MVVDSGIPVTRTTVNSSQLLAMDDVQLLPGETYPSQSIHLIQIQGNGFISKYVFLFQLLSTIFSSYSKAVPLILLYTQNFSLNIFFNIG